MTAAGGHEAAASRMFPSPTIIIFGVSRGQKARPRMLLTSVVPQTYSSVWSCPPVMAVIAVVGKEFLFGVEVAVPRLAAIRALRLIFEYVRQALRRFHCTSRKVCSVTYFCATTTTMLSWSEIPPQSTPIREDVWNSLTCCAKATSPWRGRDALLVSQPDRNGTTLLSPQAWIHDASSLRKLDTRSAHLDSSVAPPLKCSLAMRTISLSKSSCDSQRRFLRP